MTDEHSWSEDVPLGAGLIPDLFPQPGEMGERVGVTGCGGLSGDLLGVRLVPHL